MTHNGRPSGNTAHPPVAPGPASPPPGAQGPDRPDLNAPSPMGPPIAYRIMHTTVFTYAEPVATATLNLRLRPVDGLGQNLIDHRYEVQPEGRFSLALHKDMGLSHLDRLSLTGPFSRLTVTSIATVEVPRAGWEPAPDDLCVADCRAEARAIRSLDAHSPAFCLAPSPRLAADPAIIEWAAPTLTGPRGIRAAALDLAQRIHRDFHYAPGTTNTETAPGTVLATRNGVCQDFAQLMIIGLRGAGIPAAYVSGYLRTLPPLGEDRLIGADASHGWVMVWGGARIGWFGVDPTNGIAVGPDHVIVAVGRDYGDVAPIDGLYIGGGGQHLSVSVDVAPLHTQPTGHNLGWISGV